MILGIHVSFQGCNWFYSFFQHLTLEDIEDPTFPPQPPAAAAGAPERRREAKMGTGDLPNTDIHGSSMHGVNTACTYVIYIYI